MHAYNCTHQICVVIAIISPVNFRTKWPAACGLPCHCHTFTSTMNVEIHTGNFGITCIKHQIYIIVYVAYLCNSSKLYSLTYKITRSIIPLHLAFALMRKRLKIFFRRHRKKTIVYV